MTAFIKERNAWWIALDPGALCRDLQSRDLVCDTSVGQVRTLGRTCQMIAICAALYGAVFGLWRSPEQAVYAALKLPLLLFAVVLASGVVNTMLAQVLGAPLSLGAVCLMMLTGMAIASVLLAGLAPVVLFFTLQMPPPDPAVVGLPTAHPSVAPSLRVFQHLLVLHIATIGFAGVIGNLRLYATLKKLAPQTAVARRIMLAWLLVSGFAGCELSWLFSPFICKPNFPPHLITRTYWEGNFYEHLYHALCP